MWSGLGKDGEGKGDETQLVSKEIARRKKKKEKKE